MIDSTQCCGVKEYSGLSDARTVEAVLQDIIEDDWFEAEYSSSRKTYRGAGAFIIFTDAQEGVRARQLKAYIERHKLGQASISATRLNPNSGNMVTVLVWAVSNSGFLAWARKKKIPLTNDNDSWL